MKKWLCLLSVLLLAAGCAANPKAPETTPEATPEPTAQAESVTLSILGPTGAPALALIAPVKNGHDVTFVDGTDVLQAAFVNPNPEYDVLVAPSNLGAKLAANGKTTYRMESVITWGNLYLVAAEESALEQDGVFAAFGEGAVPGKVLETVLEKHPVTPEITWYASVAEVQGAVLAGKADVALMAEPAATATMAKAKENGQELKIILDLQEQWNAVTGTQGYPQAALFVRQDLPQERQAAVETLLQSIEDYLNQAQQDPSAVEQDIETIGAQTLGMPSGAVIAKTWPRMNLRLVAAEDVKPELTSFLNLFEVTDIESILAH